MSRPPKVFVILFLLGLAVTGLPLPAQTLAQGRSERVDSNPVWSPDGTRIAFQSIPLDDYLAGVNAGADEYNFDIWVMNAAGTNQVNLTSESPRMDANPVWSPDASAIAFVSKRSGNFDIWVMGADGSNPTNLTPQNLGADVEPRW
jgi:Tol biopolymer transport system component